MEWNNKDPFYDRDLNNFAALHREGAIAVGVIVTRGPRLQELIGPVIRSKQGGFKYGQSTTHWNKLIPRVNLGGGGECPLLLVGIEPERVDGIDLVAEVRDELAAADAARPVAGPRFAPAAPPRPRRGARKAAALDRLPPVTSPGTSGAGGPGGRRRPRPRPPTRASPAGGSGRRAPGRARASTSR